MRVLSPPDRLDVKATAFDANEVSEQGMGAGIIPISKGPNGEVFLLLGRERWTSHWKGSCRWSGFEGGRKGGEDTISTAVREFSEESLGVVERTDVVRKRLEEEDYWLKIVTLTLQDKGAYSTQNRYHCTHILPVVWDETLPSRFRNERNNLEKVDFLVQEWRHSRLQEWGEEERIGHVREEGDGCVVEVGENLVRLEGEEAKVAMNWSCLREKVEEALFSHPSVVVKRDKEMGVLQDVRIQKDYLEKDQIRWWSIKELSRVLVGRGQSDGERFRPFFLPVLQTVLDEVDAIFSPS